MIADLRHQPALRQRLRRSLLLLALLGLGAAGTAAAEDPPAMMDKSASGVPISGEHDPRLCAPDGIGVGGFDAAHKLAILSSIAFGTQVNFDGIALEGIENVTIEDITIQESTFWNLHVFFCKRVFVRGARIYSSLEKGVNSDGIDVNSCQEVTISDCIIETGDENAFGIFNG